MTKLYPLLFEPALKDYVWGGRRLERYVQRDLPSGRIAESWEIAAHPDGQSTVINGHFAGLTLAEVHERLGLALIGSNAGWAQERNKFPLLVKLLDAQERLSVQVHPSDEFAATHEAGELGKTEMWVVVEASDDAAVILGVAAGTSKKDFAQAIERNQLESHLHRMPVEAGDFICVPSGTLHAILGGVIIAEIQQNSNVTYRVYDWGRNEPDRPLHIDKAMRVINFDQIEPGPGLATPLSAGAGAHREGLCCNKYFAVERWRLPPGAAYQGMTDGSTMEIWAVLTGQAALEEERLAPVQFVLLPAAVGPFTLHAFDEVTALRAYVP